MVGEKTIEGHLREAVKRAGGRAYKWTSPGNAGVPDRIVILPGRSPIFVELKTARGVLSTLQANQIRILREMGQDVRVIRGMVELDAFLEEMGI